MSLAAAGSEVRGGSRPGNAAQAGLLLGGLGVALTARVLLGGRAPAASTPAALVFAAVLLITTLAAGWRPGPPRVRHLVIGACGAAVLVLAAAVRAQLPVHLAVPVLDGRFAIWAPAVVSVAVAEEWLLRGALHDALRPQGEAVAVLTGAVAFALIHLPLYGPAALPVDLGVGVLLGGLRLLSGGAGAPAAAHALADLATWVVV